VGHVRYRVLCLKSVKDDYRFRMGITDIEEEDEVEVGDIRLHRGEVFIAIRLRRR